MNTYMWESKYSRNDFKHVISTVICWPSSQVALSNRPGTIRPFKLRYSRCLQINFNKKKFLWSRRPAFAPIYANQYSSQQSNQAWTNAGSQYHSLAVGNNASSGSAQINKRGGSDGDAALANNIRKEKRQYKKRKHKNQRDKPPYPTPGNLNTIIHSANKHRRISFANLFVFFFFLLILGPTADAMVSSDEEEQAANNNTNSNSSSNNHLRHETEDDGLFPFRRSNANQYHRVCVLSLCSIA